MVACVTFVIGSACLPPRYINDRSVTYAEFRRAVSAYKPGSILRGLARHSAINFRHPQQRLQCSDPLLPWAVSLLAREALTAPGKSTRKSPDRRPATENDLRRLGALAIALEDPLIAQPGTPNAVESFAIRTAYQQFMFQEPVFHDMARMRPMFDRPFSSERFEVLSAQSLCVVLGGPLDVFVDSGPFFVAAAMKNAGLFDPEWLQGPQFEEVRNRIDIAELLKIFMTAWAAPWADLRSEAIRAQSSDQRLRQYDWNPFLGRPFVEQADGEYLAPQAWYVASRVRPSAVYYLGLVKYGDAWARDLGLAHEDYIRLQLEQLKPATSVYGEFEYDTGSGSGKTVDAIVVLDDAVVLVEAKSVRTRLDSRCTFAAYTDHLQRDLRKAFTQIARTAHMVRNHHTALGGAVPDDRPLCGLVVTPEPLWLANNAQFTAGYPDPTVPTSIVSLRELEDLVAYGREDRKGTVWLDATKADEQGNRNPHAALYRHQQSRGKIPQNPLLKEAFDTGAWQ